MWALVLETTGLDWKMGVFRAEGLYHGSSWQIGGAFLRSSTEALYLENDTILISLNGYVHLCLVIVVIIEFPDCIFCALPSFPFHFNILLCHAYTLETLLHPGVSRPCMLLKIE